MPAATVTNTCSALSLSAWRPLRPAPRARTRRRPASPRRRRTSRCPSRRSPTTSPTPNRCPPGTWRAPGRRSATTRSLTCRPARSSPDSNASPMLPPPMIAILAMPESIADGSARRCYWAVYRAARRHHRQLARLRHDAAQAVDDDVVLVEPVLPDLDAGADHSQPAVGRQSPKERGELDGRRPAGAFHRECHRRRQSPHMRANSASGATPRGRAHIWITGGRPSVLGASVDSTVRMSQPSPRCTRPASG